jgi:quercetin dioxygenase-like cupin family protein
VTPRSQARRSGKGPAESNTGDVWPQTASSNPTTSPSSTSAQVHFPPGARTAWHSHEGGQTLYITEGKGLAQSRAEEIVEIRAGDVHLTPDGKEHWRGAAHDHFMTHISITQGPATWGDNVTDA